MPLPERERDRLLGRRAGAATRVLSRSQAEALVRLAPPVYVGSGEKNDALAWISGRLTQWYKESLSIRIDANQAFLDACKGPGAPVECVDIIHEVAAMSALLHDRLVEAAMGAAPHAWLEDAVVRSAYEDTWKSLANRLYASVVSACAEHAGSSHDTSATARDCLARQAALGSREGRSYGGE